MRALALFSGGLDSMLAMKTISDMGIEVIALHMNTGFGGSKDKRAIMERRAKIAGAKFEVIDIREEFIKKILFDPKHGYGKYFNPCIDCHGYMFKIAKALLPKYDASFIITGEVVGQRPMSQRLDAIETVTELAEDEDGLILRPMTAKNLKPTKPEIEGWVDREKLYGIKGRSRETQLSLAKKFGWEDYQSPGGGCLLTEAYFSKKIEEFVKYDKLEVEDINVLKYGRHFRLPDGAKLVVGRNQEENETISKINSNKYEFIKLPVIGPLSLISKNASDSDKELATRIALTYAKTSPNQSYHVKVGDKTYLSTPFESKTKPQEYFIQA